MSFYCPTSHRGQGGSILLVHYSLIVLKPDILDLMTVGRYNHFPISSLECYSLHLNIANIYNLGLPYEADIIKKIAMAKLIRYATLKNYNDYL